MQTEDFDWFVENYDDLYKRYGLCYLAIKDKKVLGYYENPKKAISEVTKEFPLGSFIVQLCNGNKFGYTNYIANTQITVI